MSLDTISSKSSKTGFYKQEQFKAFIKHLENGTAAHWVDVAEQLGVDRKTIQNWRKLPEARRAVRDGISYALEQMEKAGKRDWRMWEAKLKMLGINPVSKQQFVDDEGKAYNPVEEIIKGTGLRADLEAESKTNREKVAHDRQSDGDIPEPSETKA